MCIHNYIISNMHGFQLEAAQPDLVTQQHILASCFATDFTSVQVLYDFY